MNFLLFFLVLTVLFILIILISKHYFSRYQYSSSQSYEPFSLRGNYKAGDIVLFQYHGPNPNSGFKYEIGGNIPSHIGILVENPMNGTIYLTDCNRGCDSWELANDESCLYGSNGIHGVKITKLKDLVDTFPGRLVVRRLNIPLTRSQKRKLWNLAKENENKTFDMSAVSMLKSPLAIVLHDLGFKKTGTKLREMTKKDGLFCSQYVSFLLENLGILDGNSPIWTYAPYMFTENSRHNDKFLGKYGYGKEIRIK